MFFGLLSFIFCVFPLLPEMLESSNLITFNGLANSSSYDAFLLDEERGRLLVGAEDHIFSFDLVNINRDQKQVSPHPPAAAHPPCFPSSFSESSLQSRRVIEVAK